MSAITLNVPFHIQDCEKHCAPACIVMMLQSLHRDTSGLTQKDVLARVQALCKMTPDSGCAGLATPPHLLAEAANKLLAELPALQTPPPVAYAVFSPPDALPETTEVSDNSLVCPLSNAVDDSWTILIRDSFASTGAPVFALYDRGRHWILFYGWKPGNTEREYLYHSPAGNWPCPPIVDHKSDCKGCDQPLTYPQLESTLLNTAFGPNDHPNSGQWNCRRALVVPYRTDQETPAWVATGGFPLAEANAAPEFDSKMPRRNAAPLAQRLRRLWSSLTGGLSARAAVRRALRRAGGSPFLRQHCDGAADKSRYPGALKVFHPDGTGEDYFLVPTLPTSPEGETILQVIDARTGENRLTALLAPGDIGKMAGLLWADKAAHPPQITAEILQLYKGSARPAPTGRFVWKSCDQSDSPLWPFLEVKVNGQVQWMDLRGTLFCRLTRTRGGL